MMHSAIRAVAILFCIATLNFAQAQNLNIASLNPQNLKANFAPDEEIVFSFSEPLMESSIEESVNIFGQWTGPKRFDYTLSNSNKTLAIKIRHAEDPLNAGEKLSISISKSLHAASGQSLEHGYAVQYFVAAKYGSLNQTRGESIPLRQNGETWLQTYGAFAGDLDNDGFSDLTVINEHSDDLRILINNGIGGYGDLQVIPMNSGSPSPNDGGDFNKDGETDLAVATAHHQELRVMMGDGLGGFYSQEDYQTGSAARGVAVLDFNGDGNDDIAVANRNSSSIHLFENDGTGNFASTSFNPEGTGESGLVAADANNDGIMDLFVGYHSSKEIGILLGDGKGNFTQSGKISVIGRPWMMAVADLNGDGFADVASANAEGNITVVSFGDGQGGLSAPDNYALPEAQFPLSIDLGDLDGDGDLDMVTSNYKSNNYIVWENNALGVMSKTAVMPASANASCAVLHDRDNDGDLDITGTDETDDLVILFINDQASPVQDLESLSASITTEISPNPFWNRLKVKLNLPRGGRTDIRIMDGSGRTIERLHDARLVAGQHYFGWDGRQNGVDVPGGVYYFSVTQNGKVFSFPISKGS